MTLDQPLELITIVMINDDSLSFKSLIILYGLQVENYCSLHVCAAARGPEIKDECMHAGTNCQSYNYYSTIIKLVRHIS